MRSVLAIRDVGRPTEYNLEEPWQRQPCDHDAQWAAFRAWLEAPIPRRFEWLSRRTGVVVPKLNSWASQYGWRQRAHAFDNWCHAHFHERVEAVLEERADDYVSRHVSMLTQASELAANELRKFLDASRSNSGIGLLTAREMIMLVDTTIKLERLVRGDSTVNIHADVDLGKLSPEDLVALKRLQEKAGIK